MRLIEKKCPNCGAGLEFEENDKSCKCDYCKRSYIIERENNDKKSISAENFNLSELKGPAKIFGTYILGSYIITSIVFGIVFITIIGLLIFFGIKSYNSTKDFEENYKDNYVVEEKVLTKISDVSEGEIEDIIRDSKFKINLTADGENNVSHSYTRDGDPELQNIYLAYKKGENRVIAIFKTTYTDFFNKSDSSTIYVPIIYENIKEGDFNNLGNGKISAPKYYLSSDQKCYFYGYGSLDEAYSDIILPLESDYKISKK